MSWKASIWTGHLLYGRRLRNTFTKIHMCTPALFLESHQLNTPVGYSNRPVGEVSLFESVRGLLWEGVACMCTFLLGNQCCQRSNIVRIMWYHFSPVCLSPPVCIWFSLSPPFSLNCRQRNKGDPRRNKQEQKEWYILVCACLWETFPME